MNNVNHLTTFKPDKAKALLWAGLGVLAVTAAKLVFAEDAPAAAEAAPQPAGKKGIIKLAVIGLLVAGLGGGAASSMASGSGNEDLDFASVQRDNAEMERRCQEVIDRCWALGDDNPISFIHDVGAGGISNALPELVNDGGRGGSFELRTVPNDEPGMSPVEIWCNESQERYVLSIPTAQLPTFTSICQRERCPFCR